MIFSRKVFVDSFRINDMSNILIKSANDKTSKKKKRAIIVGALLLSLFVGFVPLIFLSVTTTSMNSSNFKLIPTASNKGPVQIGLISRFAPEDSEKIVGQMGLDENCNLIPY